jgi:hypothetical protein
MFALTLAVAATAPGVRVDVPARLAQLLVLDFSKSCHVRRRTEQARVGE